ncbi:hypothetical protein LEMLEM_LOCUS5996 [Lemmus lemmus]
MWTLAGGQLKASRSCLCSSACGLPIYTASTGTSSSLFSLISALVPRCL